MYTDLNTLINEKVVTAKAYTPEIYHFKLQINGGDPLLYGITFKIYAKPSVWNKFLFLELIRPLEKVIIPLLWM